MSFCRDRPPPDIIKNIKQKKDYDLTTMPFPPRVSVGKEYTKLNVLHLHASDMCRFGVESKLYPALHTKMTAPAEHYYSQDDIKAMIKYGKANGIR